MSLDRATAKRMYVQAVDGARLQGASDDAAHVAGVRAVKAYILEHMPSLDQVRTLLADVKNPTSYELAPDGSWIKCLRCGTTSWNTGDVQHRYCGKCHAFHEDLRP
jgi:hypothetical protein